MVDISKNDPRLDEIKSDFESIGALSFPVGDKDVTSFVTKFVPEYICDLTNTTQNCKPLDELLSLINVEAEPRGALFGSFEERHPFILKLNLTSQFNRTLGLYPT